MPLFEGAWSDTLKSKLNLADQRDVQRTSQSIHEQVMVNRQDSRRSNSAVCNCRKLQQVWRQSCNTNCPTPRRDQIVLERPCPSDKQQHFALTPKQPTLYQIQLKSKVHVPFTRCGRRVHNLGNSPQTQALQMLPQLLCPISQLFGHSSKHKEHHTSHVTVFRKDTKSLGSSQDVP